MSEAKKIALEWLKENEKKLIDIHQEIWELAEVGLQEIKTAKKLTDIFEDKGFRVEKGVAGMPSAFVASYGEGKPVIGIMGELDALPGISNKPVPYEDPLVEGGARVWAQRIRHHGAGWGIGGEGRHGPGAGQGNHQGVWLPRRGDAGGQGVHGA